MNGMVDVSNETFIEALRWAYPIALDRKRLAHAITCGDAGTAEQREALRYFQDPDKAADLIKKLIERAGAKRCGFPYPGLDWMTCCRVDGHDPPHAHCLGGDGFECLSEECMTEDQLGDRCAPHPDVIFRLLSVARGAGPHAVLAALRGEPTP